MSVGDDAGIVAHGIGLTRAGRRVLDDAAVTVAPGRVTALVAPSGSGKSTLLRCLNRLLEPDEGTILLDGVDVRTVDPRTLRRRVALVAQAPVMLPGAVHDNLVHGLADPDPAVVARALADADLDPSFATRPAGELSGGERARVALARALTRDPRILLLDEPTAALDATTADHVADALRRIADRGIGVLVATHDDRLVARVADRTVGLGG
ncbi:MAG: ABC transporter ATP-binding protein [Solirubrobacteraceae bacterium]|nr:ABC transporter ATP-binding protein [Solirubrobacteraceae bacterium]